MEYILSLLLLVFNLINYEINLNKFVFLAVSTVIMGLLFCFVFRKTKSFLITCMMLMCHTWQISWINIFGEPTANMQLPWFYILGVMVLAYGLINLRTCFRKSYGAFSFLTFIVALLFFNYPLVISQKISEGLKEYIMIGFFIVVLFICFLFKDTVSRENYGHFKNSMIWAVFISSAAIVFQHIMYTYANVSLFKISVMLSFSGYQTNCYLLMEDHSCSTIMFGCVVFYMLEKLGKKNWFYMVPVLITVVISMALTSRRTSTLSLIIIFALYVLFHYKEIGKKLVFTGIGILAGGVMMYYLLIARPVESFSQLFNDNGRLENYAAALDIIKKYPLGVGYDGTYIDSMMPGSIAPHNTVLRWCTMGGIPLAAILVSLVFFSLSESGKKKMTAEYWAVLYAMFASNFIPDILNARFFVILCSVAFLIKKENLENPLLNAEKEKIELSFADSSANGIKKGRRSGVKAAVYRRR